MSDKDNVRMRELTYRLMRMAPPAPPFPEEPMTQLTPTRPPRRRPAAAWAGIGAAIVLVVIGLPAWFIRGPQGDMLATTTAPTSAPAPSTSVAPDSAPVTEAPDPSPFDLIDLSGLDWVRTDVALQGVVGSDGRIVIDHPVPPVNYKYMAWDGGEGLVLLSETGELRWVRPEADIPVPVDVLDGEVTTIDDVILIGGRPVAALRSWTGETAWVDLETGEEVAGDPTRVDYFDDLGLQLGGQGRLVRIEYPENLDAERDETGALVWPFELPELVVMTTDGAELARIELGNENQPWARLHDFDGRRVIVSVEPLEPAFPPTTVYVIDLECADCTEVIDLPSADTLDLVGIVESTGSVLADFDL